ncbi:MAG: sigma-70 family RNA polymerase sigma factor [Acidobacteriota bacterium]|nr:sigma-70 family RNA polymerase sigma factor [Acidobacteriota bacterium]
MSRRESTTGRAGKRTRPAGLGKRPAERRRTPKAPDSEIKSEGGEDDGSDEPDTDVETLEPDELLVLDDESGSGEADTADGEIAALVPAGDRLPAAADPLSRYIQEVRRFPELDHDRERQLARRYRELGDREAARELITANLRLVVKLALMYRRALRNVMDLIQEGNIGLMEALKRYDPEQGVRFSTYASWWIKAYMLKFLMDNARLVRVGTTNARRKLLYNLRKEQRKLQSQGIDPTPRLLAERFGVSQDDVVEVDRALSSRDTSVDAPLSDDSRATIADVMPTEEMAVDEQVAAAEIREKVDEAIAAFRQTIGERERAILDLRLVAEDPATLQDLGDRFGVTREAMRQAEVKLKKSLAVYLRDRLGEEIVLRFSGDG